MKWTSEERLALIATIGGKRQLSARAYEMNLELIVFLAVASTEYLEIEINKYNYREYLDETKELPDNTQVGSYNNQGELI